MSQSEIVIRGAREHNLQNVSLTLPKNQLIVMTGVSGSGKSSLAFDTLYAEGQRRYVESLSSYARQFLGQMPKPEVDSITGLSPSISIQQKTAGRNPRSTVGTITEIYDYLRVLFARVGQGFCPKCDRPITAQTVDQILDSLGRMPAGQKFLVLAPVISRQKGEYRDLFEDLLKQGFLRARVNGEIVHLTENLQLDRQMRHTIEVVVDRLTTGTGGRTRLAEAVENAVRLSNGSVIISQEAARPVTTDGQTVAEVAQETRPAKTSRKRPSKTETDATEEAENPPAVANIETLYSTHYACTHCGISYEPPSPQLFSFNSPQGMCPDCQGLGVCHDFDLAALITDGTKSLNQGCIDLLGPIRSIGRWRKHIYQGVGKALETDHGLEEGAVLTTPWNELPAAVQKQFLYGMGDRHITYSWKHSGGLWKHGGTYTGYIPELLDAYRKAKNPMRRKQLEKYMQVVHCRTCDGARLNPQARAVRVTTSNVKWEEITAPYVEPTDSQKRSKRKGVKENRTLALKDTAQTLRKRSLGLTEVCAFSIAEANEFFQSLDLDAIRQQIAGEALKEIRGRLGFLLRCGLNYLTLDRTAPTLSGGESQRIRLAGQIGCGLVGVVYILDEPSIGLHPRDNGQLLQSLLDLRDLGNTVIVVEHDEETIRAADHLVDFGPGPGVRGGEVVAQGSLAEIKKATRSLTGRFLSGRDQIAVPKTRRTPTDKQLKIVGARHNNLRNVDVAFPLGMFICVTGVSGSGKSSLVNDILWETLNRDLNKGLGNPGLHDKIEGLELLDKAIDIDQSPIGRTPRSNPATYVKLFDLIRDLYSNLSDSKLRGYEPGRFSFNVPGGRCEACEGHGSNKLEMDFLADIWVTCPVCEGRRFNHETLEVKFKEKNIAELLDMDIQQAIQHFENIPKIHHLLQTLAAVGLDYLKLGQPSPTLSGGEAQRIKLARELGKRSTGGTIYLLDEPTTGLHFVDIQKLLEVLHGFVKDGNTVLVVEHNLDVIKTADWVIDLGPEGGSGGGRVLVAGTPEDVAKCAESHTGRALAEVLWPEKVQQKVALAPAAQRLELDPGKIIVRGAAQHNLQKIDIEIPRDEMNVFCGPSGSGKSSLAMDTLYAEGQRRYVESLSAYARQFLGQMPKPKLDHISGLSPAIAIEQKTVGHTPRSTVGTVTEIYDYLRILFARLGQPYCPACDIPVKTQTTDEVIEKILAYAVGTRLLLLAPQEVVVGASYTQLWERMGKDGYSRVRIDGITYRLDEVPEMDRRRKHQVEIVVDRVTIDPKQRGRLAESIESAMDLGQGVLIVSHVSEDAEETDWREDRFSLHFACEQCGRSFEELTPHNFSFNAPLGWCPACEGLGMQLGTDVAHIIADPRKSILKGAISTFPEVKPGTILFKMLKAIGDLHHFDLDVPFSKLSAGQQRIIFYGTGERWVPLEKGSLIRFQYKGLYPALEEASRVSFVYRQRLADMQGEVACTTCHGSRLRDDAGAVRFQGRTLQEVCEMPLGDSLAFFKALKLKTADKKVAGDLLTEVLGRLSFLVDVGLEYLNLSRPLPTLSGGESQRIRLAGQIGRALTGVLYVLDEPTIGLHPRDNARLLLSLKNLKELGNTLILVEHDREVLAAADRLYDFGPGAGRFGGTVVGMGTPKQLMKQDGSLTGKYLSGREEIPIPIERRMVTAEKATRAAGLLIKDATARPTPGDGWLELLGARMHNLRDVDLRIPLGTFTVVTGVSGSGKSSLIEETLAKAIAKRLHRAQEPVGPHDEIVGLELINKIIQVDQQPLGSTPASNPATYTGVFDQIRELFAHLPEAKVRGYRPGRFSFNRAGGRCEACEGNGQKRIEMHFLPDVWVECEVCNGLRYNAETLAVKYRGRSISEVLNLSIGQALELFENIPKIRAPLATLCAIGLDYLTLGQSAPTLSGGEAQRVKLAAELARPQTGKTLYVLDEPTTGLHFDDIRKLLKVLDSLVALGNTVVVIEHNLDVIKTADWIIDMGPEAGEGGGWIVAEGTPEEVVEHSRKYALQTANAETKKATKKLEPVAAALHRSYTGEMLESILADGIRSEREIFDRKAVAKKREGDVELKQVGQSAKMPWETDGRQWHLEQRIGHNGKPGRWETQSLVDVIDALDQSGSFAPTNWNSRSIVEVAAKKAADGWFLHALTGDEWLLKLNFHVPRNTFQQQALTDQLNLTPLDDLDEIQVYGRGPRVQVVNRSGPWQEVSITLHWHKEMNTPGFKKFLKDAQAAFLKTTSEAEGSSIEDKMPWKVLGKKWHLSRKGFPTTQRVAWEPAVLERLVEMLEQVSPGGTVDWTGKQTVTITSANSEAAWATITTKRRAGLDLVLATSPGRFALGRIAAFGAEREIVSSKNKKGTESIQIRFDNLNHLTPDLQSFFHEHARIAGKEKKLF
jgi:excinuclease ABC subunit A